MCECGKDCEPENFIKCIRNFSWPTCNATIRMYIVQVLKVSSQIQYALVFQLYFCWQMDSLNEQKTIDFVHCPTCTILCFVLASAGTWNMDINKCFSTLFANCSYLLFWIGECFLKRSKLSNYFCFKGQNSTTSNLLEDIKTDAKILRARPIRPSQIKQNQYLYIRSFTVTVLCWKF